ncbi:phospholipid carrier-dependent glycosyltransferase [Spirillospora sp. CA-294931]|uniref:phospholipid carrier-dependent glycosyltransferase n=1 Tax=Spirillospora sp. CA-294931 TaxID=3240042 RepID=UPI003D8ED123
MAGDTPHGTVLDDDPADGDGPDGSSGGAVAVAAPPETPAPDTAPAPPAVGRKDRVQAWLLNQRDAADPVGWLRARATGSRDLVRRHPFFAVILAIGALLRCVAMIGYQPAMFFNDSFDYLHVAMEPYPHPLRPDGYSFLLLILKPFHSFALVTAVQHAMGLGMGAMIYALLRRKFALPKWGAALAAAPVLLDGYQIQLEHLILSDTMFTFLVMCAVTVLLWNDRPTWKVAASVGLIVGLAWLTRSVGMPVLLGVLTYMLIRRTGWRMLAITLAAASLPVLAYMGWYKADQGKFAMTESNGIFLYARVYKFADCHKFDVPTNEIPLCVEPANRLPNSQDGIWNVQSPLNRYPGLRFSPEQNATANEFSKRVIKAQPVDYLKVVGHDFLRVFQWERTVFPDKATYQQYEFGKTSSALPNWRMDNDSTAAGEAEQYEAGPARTQVVEPFAGIVRTYQDHVYLRGTLVGVLLMLGLVGVVGMWRRLGGLALLPWTLATGLLLAPAATAEFDYRYVLPAIPLSALAAGITFSREVRGHFVATGRLAHRAATATAARFGSGSGSGPAEDEPVPVKTP